MKNLTNRIKAAWQILTDWNTRYITATATAEHTTQDVCKAIIRHINKQLYNAQISEEGYEATLARYQMIESILNDRSVILLSMYQDDEETIPAIIYDCATDADFQTLASINID